VRGGGRVPIEFRGRRVLFSKGNTLIRFRRRIKISRGPFRTYSGVAYPALTLTHGASPGRSKKGASKLGEKGGILEKSPSRLGEGAFS